MAKEFFVLRGGKVVYKHGHYNREDAEKVARIASRQHPRTTIHVVRIETQYYGVPLTRNGLLD